MNTGYILIYFIKQAIRYFRIVKKKQNDKSRGKLCDNQRKRIYLKHEKIETGCNRWNCSDFTAHCL